MKYLSKYFEDKRFVQWVLSPDSELDEWWNEYVVSNPAEKHNIRVARNILHKLLTKDKELSENDKIVIFSKVLKQVEKSEKRERRFFISLLKYAAVAVLFFSLGVLIFYRQDNFNPQFSINDTTEPVDSNEAKLIRPDGRSIFLSEKRSVIEHYEDGSVIVNEDILESGIPTEKGIPEMNQLVIPYGKTSEVLLSDGTKVYLNAGSRLVYPEFFVDKTREVFLVGEAFFEVERNSERPFIVQTTDIRIKALGTSFNVSAYSTDNIIETVLTEGGVRLEHNNSGLFGEEAELKPGQLATVDKSSRETEIFDVNTENYTLWKDGMYKFESSDLSRVVKRLERFYNIRFCYEDPFLGSIKISGKLGLSENKEDIISNIAAAAAVNIIKMKEDYYEISK